MRIRTAVLTLSAVLVATVPAGAVPPAAAGVLASDNVDFVVNIPVEGAIGAKILGDLMYVTNTTGLSIYDISEGLPIPVGALALPHWENESVDTNGELLLISADWFVAGDFATVLAVIDVSNPMIPMLKSITHTGDGHTITCVADCRYAWNSGSEVIDLTDPSAPKIIGNLGTGYSHNWNLDAAGLMWGPDGSSVFDLNGYAGETIATPLAYGYVGWHGSMRPNATPIDTPAFRDQSIDPGEVVFGDGEDLYDYNLPGGNCYAEDALRTTWFHEVDDQLVIDQLDEWHVGTDGTLPEQKPFAATFCSSHWLDVHEDIVSIGWYEQGTRLIDASDPSDLRQIGYFMPLETQTWGAYMHETADGTLYVYSIDLLRGIDVFTFSGRAGDATQLAPKLNPNDASLVPSSSYGWSCRVPAGSQFAAV